MRVMRVCVGGQLEGKRAPAQIQRGGHGLDSCDTCFGNAQHPAHV